MDSQQIAQLFNLEGKTYVVTGGAGVLGGDVVCALVAAGANVAILDLRLDPVPSLLERMGPSASRVHAVQGSVLSRDSLSEAAAVVADRFGPIDGLVNTAGGNKPTATTAPGLSFFDLPEEGIRLATDLNILGTILPCQVFGKLMASRKEGVILNISSMAAYRPLTRVVVYSAAKAAITNFTQWMAVYMAQEFSPKIRVNAIAPGFLLTDQNRFLLTDKDTGALTARGQSILAHTPMGRFGVTDDLLGAVLWLLSPASAFVTGIVLPVDGGFSAFSGV